MRKIFAPLTGGFVLLFLITNTIFWATPIYLLTPVKYLTRGRLRDAVSRAMAHMGQTWAGINVIFSDAVHGTHWDIRGTDVLKPDGQYLVCCNHQTWNDIFVLMKAFGRRAPFFKFFLKQQLIWVPVLGLAWWGLDYPFMKRYTKEQIEKNPELKGKDLATTRIACERYVNQPVTILNFLEGTRFTAAKHARQQSPYKHLLKPKSGGFAFVVSAMGAKLNSLLDVTIVYPEGAMGFWDFLCGHVRSVVVEVRRLEIPPEFFRGSYENDPVFRQQFQDWIAKLWQDKDRLIGEMKARAAMQPA
ncbi:MAG: acyltransferase [Pseudomonadota bacterium]